MNHQRFTEQGVKYPLEELEIIKWPAEDKIVNVLLKYEGNILVEVAQVLVEKMPLQNKFPDKWRINIIFIFIRKEISKTYQVIIEEWTLEYYLEINSKKN